MAKQYSKREPREFNWLRAFFQWLVTSVGYANIYRFCCGYKVLGRENLPKDEFYIVASNHVSAIDPFLMCDAITKSVAYMAKKELFETFWSRVYMDFMGAFAVDREKLQVSTIKTALGIKQTKWVLGLFPQGTREAVCNLESINRGFAGIAKNLKCPIVPVGIIGSTREDRGTKGKKMIYNIGKPIPYNPDTGEMMKIWCEEIAQLTNFDEVMSKLDSTASSSKASPQIVPLEEAKPKNNYARKYAKDFNIFTRLYQLYALYIIFMPATFLFYKFKTTGRENIKKNKNYIFAPNHISYFDPFISTYATNQRQSFMAKKELFDSSDYLAKNISRLGAFSVNREKPEASTIKSCIEAIRAKWNLCIFPQGGIRKNKKIEEINKGFVSLAKKSKVDIVPIAISGLEHYNWKLFSRARVNINIGEPISYLENEDVIVEKWRKQVASMAGYELVELQSEKCHP